jgi:hypothetical protein
MSKQIRLFIRRNIDRAPIADEFIRPFMLPYLPTGERRSRPNEVNLSRKWNQPYSVDREGFMREPVGGQIAQMEAANAEQEFAEDEMSEPPNEAVAAALAKAQDDYAADLQQQIANARIAAEHSDEVNDFVRAEQNANVESGEFDQYDSPREEPKPVGVKPKSYVKRNGTFVAASTVYLVPGEKLYRYRKRSLGVCSEVHSLWKSQRRRIEIK